MLVRRGQGGLAWQHSYSSSKPRKQIRFQLCQSMCAGAARTREPTPHGGKRRANILFSVTGASVWVRARVCGQCFQPGRCSRSKQSRSRFHGGNAGARDSGAASVEQMQILLIEQLKNNDGSYFCELKARGGGGGGAVGSVHLK